MDVSLANTVWNLIPFFVLLIVWEFYSLVIISESARRGNWVRLGTDEWVPILQPTLIFLWVDGNMEIDSWAFPSNGSGDALLAVGSKQGQTDTLSHKSVLAMSNVWKVV